MVPENIQKRKKIIYFIIALVFGLAFGAAGYVVYKQFFTNDETPISKYIPKKTSKADTIANPLDGTQSNKSTANRNPIAVIIENHPDSRPQTGLEKASIIYEAITEGGITRYMAIYGPESPDKVGPVRSLRTFFLDWSYEYNAFLAHVGGNIDALDRVPVEGALDLDQFAVGDKAYWREPTPGKAIEHTMYASITKLYDVAKTKGWNMTADFTSFKFLNPDSFDYGVDSQSVTIPFSSPTYQVKYFYDSITKKYKRYLAGYPHKDKITGNPLMPTNVIIQSVNRTHTPTRINEESWTFDTIGQGDAIVFIGGIETKCVWIKQDLKARTKFFDLKGKEIQYLPGQFCYEIVPPDVFSQVKIEETSASQTSPSL